MMRYRYWWKIVVMASVIALLASCRANAPGGAEAKLVNEIKKQTVGGQDWRNPLPDTPENVKTGAEHFQHHCQICHGLDGHNTGVPFANTMSPPVADLGENSVQTYTDGQLKWIIQNGIRFTGMPGWSGIVDDNEQWAIVDYIRHLPAKGSLGAPPVFQEAGEEHEHAEGQSSQPHRHGGHEHKH